MRDFRSIIRTKIGMYLLIATYSIVLFLAITNIGNLIELLKQFVSAISPFLVGIGMAFVLNLPMTFIEKKLLIKLNISDKLRRGLAIILTFVFVFVFIYGIITFVLPQVKDSLVTVTQNIPVFAAQVQTFATEFLSNFEIPGEVMNEVSNQFTNVVSTTLSLISNLVPFVINLVSYLANSAFNFVLSVMLSIYMMGSKERVIRGMKQVLYAICNIEVADKVLYVARLANYTFSRFIGGQLTEAFILGTLTTIGMFILHIDYAVLIGLLIGMGNLVPIFGAFVAAAPCVILLIMISPMKAIVFVIFLLILQQFENNLIYPKVVGTSIGIPGMWIIFALLLGGSMFGVLGVLLGIPAFAVFYTLLKEWSASRIKNKQIDIE